MRFAVVLALACSLMSSPANAWWSYAKWGMTVQELEQASGGKLEACDLTCRNPINGFHPTFRIRNVSAADMKGDAFFAFDPSGRLNWTILTFDEEAAFGALERALTGVYGASVDKVRTSVKVTTWRNGDKETTIRLVDFGGKLAGTFVEYRPTPKGL